MHSFIHRRGLSRRTTRPRALAGLLCVLLLGGCASGGFIAKSLEFVGLKTPDSLASAKESAGSISDAAASAKEELAKLPIKRDITLRIHAGQVLNTDRAGRPLSLVTRIYRLRSTAQFNQATYAMFAASDAAKPAFAEDVISMNEVVLTPGQKYEVVESLLPEVSHLAIVALFRAPDEQRWRFVFDTKAAARSGVTVGAHGCALSVSEGEPLGVAPEALRVAGVRCR